MSFLRNLTFASYTRPVLVVPKASKSKLAPVKLPTEHALEHFDAFYTRVFGVEQWRSTRLALLSMKKSAAIVNPYTVTDELLEKMQKLGAIELKMFHGTFEPTIKRAPIAHVPAPKTVSMTEKEEPPVFDESTRLIKEGQAEAMLSYVPATEMIYQEEVFQDDIYFEFLKPETEVLLKSSEALALPNLRVFTFPRGCIDKFPAPRNAMGGLLEYYLMDASSLLPVTALGLNETDHFADFCAAPGGKSLAVAFCQKTSAHFCSDSSPARINRLRKVFKLYLPEKVRDTIEVKHVDITAFEDKREYDKILVDVPCTNDRLSLTEPSSNIFHPARIQDRLEIPQTQTKLLTTALKRLRCGGAAVYSTCSMSPVQNDSVVHMAIQSFKERKFVVTNLNKTFEPFQNIFKFYPECRYGQLVLPYLPMNFGPMYICRIERVH